MGSERGLQARLAAWIHDPAEKALVLMRDPAGHEGGTVLKLGETIFPGGLADELKRFVKLGDHWASAADRPDLPREADGRYRSWARIDFQKEGVLIHPLDGGVTPLNKVVASGVIDWAEARALSTDHFESLVVKASDGSVDLERSMLNFWRFGPETPVEGLAALWQQLPAETRFSDHTIWAHLDLCSAFAGAAADDSGGDPALLLFSLGPVQSFIAQSRTVSDLWAGSHMLSRMAWEAMKVVCEACGPQALLFPQLRGVPLVDAWLEQEKGLRWPDGVPEPEWKKSATDANPLFQASLPNRFVAVVPSDQAEELAGQAEEAARKWLLAQARNAANLVWQRAGLGDTASEYAVSQIDKQCEGFPRASWSTVSWGLVDSANKEGRLELSGDHLNTGKLGELATHVFPPAGAGNPLLSDAMKAVEDGLRKDSAAAAMWLPNPGYLYPAVVGLLERIHAAAKTEKTFQVTEQQGYRCSLCAEREWLVDDPATLEAHDRESSSPWTQLQSKRRDLAKKGERLCAVCALKRAWPRLFADGEVSGAVGGGKVDRFNVSTHTMAVAGPLSRWFRDPAAQPPSQDLIDRLGEVSGQAALPRGLAAKIHGQDEQVKLVARKLPLLLDELCSGDDQANDAVAREAAKFAPEQYYALLLGDGDNMGKWLAAEQEPYVLKATERWHPALRDAARRELKDKGIEDLLAAPSLPGPSHHVDISQALGAFSGHLAGEVVERQCAGRLVYAGGDDVMAMLPVSDLLRAMVMLRLAFCGEDPGQQGWQCLGFEEPPFQRMGSGWAEHRGRLHRLMGRRASMSCGAVVAHHQAPLAMVLRHLREAESRAKAVPDKDAFSITLVKRSGGALQLSAPWFDYSRTDDGHRRIEAATSPAFVLADLAAAVGSGGFSRRVAYHSDQWLRDLSLADTDDDQVWVDLLSTTLAQQFDRQGGQKVQDLAPRVVAAAVIARSRWKADKEGAPGLTDLVSSIMGVAEFFGREGRLGTDEEEHGGEPEAAVAAGGGS